MYPEEHTYHHHNILSRILYVLLDILEILLAVRFVLLLLRANPLNPAVNFFYGITNPFVAPFRGIFSPTIIQGSVLDWSTIVAMIVYALIVYLIAKLLDAVTNPY